MKRTLTSLASMAVLQAQGQQRGPYVPDGFPLANRMGMPGQVRAAPSKAPAVAPGSGTKGK